MICDGSRRVWELTVELGRHGMPRWPRGGPAEEALLVRQATAPEERFSETDVQAVAKLPVHLALYSADEQFR
jgi:hypothetical protein